MTTQDHPLSHWHTWKEIHAQPEIWQEWLAALDVAGLKAWIAKQEVEEVWFCGAGTSAYIGDIIAAGSPAASSPRLRAVPSTDLVARPQALIASDRRVLVVSFGRSGDSAETIGTLDALDALAPNWPRLNITCNSESTLATRGPGKVIVLPDACHDQGFAMTSSFSTMLLTALALFDESFDAPNAAEALAAQAKTLLTAALPDAPPPERVVYVGAGPLNYAARESALKVMELTAGQVPSLWDSSLGFRHGPKSFVTDSTAIYVLLSANPHAALYDSNLVTELRAQFPATQVTSIGPGGDIDVAWPDSAAAAALAVIPSQLHGAYWSKAFGLNVDDPFAGRGTLTRVVEGVKLHEVTR